MSQYLPFLAFLLLFLVSTTKSAILLFFFFFSTLWFRSMLQKWQTVSSTGGEGGEKNSLRLVSGPSWTFTSPSTPDGPGRLHWAHSNHQLICTDCLNFFALCSWTQLKVRVGPELNKTNINSCLEGIVVLWDMLHSPPTTTELSWASHWSHLKTKKL